MHDSLYENPKSLEDEFLFQLADELGLSARKLRESLAAETYRARIDTDFRGGVRSGVNGTPTFFIKGQRHDGPYYFNDLLAAIQQV